MQVGTKVIRKTDIRDACLVTGEIVGLESRGRVRVRWHVSQYGGHHDHASTLKASSLVEASEEVLASVRERMQARQEAHKAKLDAERIYLCTNVNPRARGSLYGHPKPLPLTKEQAIDGKCIYCACPVSLREERQPVADALLSEEF